MEIGIKFQLMKMQFYSLTFSDLTSLGINTNNLDVNSIRLYGNGGGMLPRLKLLF